MPIQRHNDESAVRDNRDPVKIRRSQWIFWQALVPGIQQVLATTASQQLSEPKGVLVGEVDGSEAASGRAPATGNQLESNGLVDLRWREVVEVG